jgi:hypothetical protein
VLLMFWSWLLRLPFQIEVRTFGILVACLCVL